MLFCSIGLYQNLGLALAPDNANFIENNNFRLAILGFVLYTATFVCETLRSGFNTVPLGQAEAARSSGCHSYRSSASSCFRRRCGR